MSSDIFANLANPRHWFNPEPGQGGPLFLAFGAIALVALVVAWYVRWRRRSLFAGDALRIAMAKRATGVALWLAGIALLLIVARLGNVPYLATPILFYLTVLATLAAIGYGVYYATQRYPLERVALETRLERERYLPGVRRRATGGARFGRQRSAVKRR